MMNVSGGCGGGGGGGLLTKEVRQNERKRQTITQSVVHNFHWHHADESLAVREDAEPEQLRQQRCKGAKMR